MAIRTKKEQLDLGVPVGVGELGDFDPDDVAAFTDAFYTAIIGRRGTPTGFGSFFQRVSNITAGVAVVADTAMATLPGPILNVQRVVGKKTGPTEILIAGTPTSGEVLITVDPLTDRDILTFAASDEVTEIQYRQIAFPQEMCDALASDTEPPIES